MEKMQAEFAENCGFDEVKRPSHYCHGGIECKDLAAAVLEDADVGPVVGAWWWMGFKYVVRCFFKGQTHAERVRDVRKARECLEELEKAMDRERLRRIRAAKGGS